MRMADLGVYAEPAAECDGRWRVGEDWGVRSLDGGWDSWVMMMVVVEDLAEKEMMINCGRKNMYNTTLFCGAWAQCWGKDDGDGDDGDRFFSFPSSGFGCGYN